ncbi:MAG: hypothetical protein DMG52_25055 [Acidobacteria bacterium]|nr:MAG: hypothetical protein DMG52_25055 [Acidobacteriota bacterium]
MSRVRKEHGPAEGSARLRGLVTAARQLPKHERGKLHDRDTNPDTTFAYMLKNGIALTLENYVLLNWMGDKTVKEVLEEAELAAALPEELVFAYQQRIKARIQ